MPANTAGGLCQPPVAVLNRHGRGDIVLVCEHASHFIPPAYDGLGLSPADQLRHINWDIGALGLAKKLAALLDAPLVHATYSRLMLDVNRSTDASDSIITHSEDTRIPGNARLSAAERKLRKQRIYDPFHRELGALIDQRLRMGLVTGVVSIHSFSPCYLGVDRPWHIGVISQRDRLLADKLLQSLTADPDLCVGDNLPYGPLDGVYHSLTRHGEARGLHSVMIEVRNDQLDEVEQKHWAHTLNDVLSTALTQTLAGN